MSYAASLLRDIDILNERISKIELQKQDIYKILKAYKMKIEDENSHLIGKKAMCVHIDNPIPVECVCTSVIALDDYLSVKPLFSRNGKKYIVESYEWI